jgi:hypothetical protein
MSGNKYCVYARSCVCVALVIQHAKGMHPIFICGLSGSAMFSTLSHKRYDFRGKKLCNIKICVECLCTFYLKNSSL